MNLRAAVSSIFGLLCINIGETVVLNDTTRWCYIDDALSLDGYLPYNSFNFACVYCGGRYHIEDRKKLQQLKCCEDDGKLKDKCNANELPCGDRGFYISTERCDGRKNCVNFGDEKNCTKECEYSCGAINKQSINVTNQCINGDQVCDRRKDCISGIDETNCTYYGGRCAGFLCTTIEECVEIAQVCDGQKDCLDGTDETMCPGYTTIDGFECNNTGFTADSICDGNENCDDKQDERYCFKWSEWSEWSSCQCNDQTKQANIISRTRICGTLHPQIDSAEKCNGTKRQEKAEECDCPPSNLSKSQIISYSLIGVIILIVLICGICIYRMSRRHKRAWLSYTQAVTFFRAPKNDTLIDPTRVELSEENQLQTFSEHNLPSTPSDAKRNQPVLQFHHSSSYQGDNSLEDSILAPMEEDSGLQSLTVSNPLYHTYSGVPQDDQTNIESSTTNNLTGYEPFASHHTSRDNLISSDEEGDNNLSEQIQVAQMGNLIEVSDLKIH